MSITSRDILSIKVALDGIQATQKQLAALFQQSQAGQKSIAVGASQAVRANQAHARSLGDVTASYARLAAGVLAARTAYEGLKGAAMAALSIIQDYEKLRAFRLGSGKILGNDALVPGLEKGLMDLGNATGTRFSTLAPSVQGLIASGNEKSAQTATETVRAFLATGAISGTPADAMDRAMVQLVQIAGQGKLQGDEVRAIAENMVTFRAAILQAGLGPRMGSQTQPITYQEVVAAMKQYAEKNGGYELMAKNAETVSGQLAILDNELIYLKELLAKELIPSGLELVKGLQNWVKGIDQEKLKATIAQVVATVKEVGSAALSLTKTVYRFVRDHWALIAAVGKAYLVFKGFQILFGIGKKVYDAIGTVLNVFRNLRLAFASDTAAAALMRLAGAANVAAVTGGGGGVVGGLGRGAGLFGSWGSRVTSLSVANAAGVGGVVNGMGTQTVNLGSNAAAMLSTGGTGIAGALNATSFAGVGSALGGGVATGVMATVVSAAAVALGAYYGTTWALENVPKMFGAKKGYNDQLAEDFARLNGARINKETGEEDYGKAAGWAEAERRVQEARERKNSAKHSGRRGDTKRALEEAMARFYAEARGR